MFSSTKLILIASLSIGAIFLFCSKNEKHEYPRLARGQIVLQGDQGQWDENSVHTLSVVLANQGGFKYWGYYGLDYYNGPAEKRKAGLAFSDDLVHWQKFPGNPILESNCRWPSVIRANGMFHMFYEEYDQDMTSRIIRMSSGDGVHFSGREVVVPSETGMQNQNPFVFVDPADQGYCLFYYRGRERGEGDHQWTICVKKAARPDGLKAASFKTILSSSEIIASPSMMYFLGRYYLTVESFRPGYNNDRWVTRAYSSSAPDGVFTETAGSPILIENDACAFQYFFEGALFVFYSQRDDAEKNVWNLRMARSEETPRGY
jgi:hypothetical protein